MSDRLSDYDFDLPEARIAQVPLADRAASRLFVLPRDGGAFAHRRFREVPEILCPGDLLVFNDTRVSARRLFGRRPTGGAVEALLLAETGEGEWTALVRPGRTLRAGARIEFPDDGLAATVVAVDDDGPRTLRFDPDPALRLKIARAGETPLPPYIHERTGDDERYQTVYAREDGSAAAPTAGLHFTHEVLDRLRERGIGTARVTLHVGLDTFRPVSVENLEEHRMHGETCEVPPETAAAVAGCEGRIVAVGTTTVRTLEHFAEGPRRVRSGREVSTLFVRPGFGFRVVDGMFTNFHLPRTTMLAMVSALCGRERLLAAYAEAIREEYRFLSFGDSMLVL